MGERGSLIEGSEGGLEEVLGDDRQRKTQTSPWQFGGCRLQSIINAAQISSVAEK